MKARVATFEGGNADDIRQAVADIGQRAESGPPEGIPAKALLLLHSDEGKVLAITLYDNEDDLRQGDATLNDMTPQTTGDMGKRSSVEMFEVGVKVEA